MPTFVIKLDHDKGPFYMEWSTVVDAPTSWGMPLAEFREHYRVRYGEHGIRSLSERLARVEQTGTSEHGPGSAEDMIRGNRAGCDEFELTIGDVIEWYCVKREGPPEGVGTRQGDE